MEAKCLGESNGLTFWVARPQDYDEVMAISHDIYYGNDYLPHRYHIWMTEPDRVVVIGRRDGRLVALESGLVVDGGQTVVVEGLRVCPTERGCGIAGVIQKVTDRYIKQVYPTVTIKRLTRSDSPEPDKISKFTFLARRAVLSLRGNAESFNGFVLGLKAKLETMQNSNGPTTITPSVGVLKDGPQLRALLLEPGLSSRLQLPGGVIMQDWQPLRPIESNLEILKRRDLTWMVDFSSDKPSFMSFHTPPYPIPFNGGSLRLNIDMFGTDLSIARKALVGHFEQVAGELQGTVTVHVYMFQDLWEGMSDFCKGDEGVKQFRDYWEQIFLEIAVP